MADREPDLVARIARAVGDLDREVWDALAATCRSRAGPFETPPNATPPNRTLMG